MLWWWSCEVLISLSFILFLLISFLFQHPKSWHFSSFMHWYCVGASITRGIQNLQTWQVYLLVTLGHWLVFFLFGSFVPFFLPFFLFFLPFLSCSHILDQRLCCPFNPGSDLRSGLPFTYLGCSSLVSFLLMFFLFRWAHIQPVNINNVSTLFTVLVICAYALWVIDYFEYPLSI